MKSLLKLCVNLFSRVNTKKSKRSFYFNGIGLVYGDNDLNIQTLEYNEMVTIDYFWDYCTGYALNTVVFNFSYENKVSVSPSDLVDDDFKILSENLAGLDENISIYSFEDEYCYGDVTIWSRPNT